MSGALPPADGCGGLQRRVRRRPCAPGEKQTYLPLLSPKFLNIIDQTLWNLPFNGKAEMEEARAMASPPVRKKDLVMFENAMYEEHTLPHARESLQRSWAAWIHGQNGSARGWRHAKFEAPPDSPGIEGVVENE